MVDECRKRGFTVLEADAIEFLRRHPAESQGCITAFHLIEHLPFDRLITLVDEIVRVLKPGGLAILETPNPDNLLVGACTFYYDPTHVRPLPKELMQFLLEARGLCSVESLPLHPNPQSGHLAEQENPTAELLKHYLYGPQDYAVIGRKV
jgi:O-antigen chain-terminating methyltransferase